MPSRRCPPHWVFHGQSSQPLGGGRAAVSRAPDPAGSLPSRHGLGLWQLIFAPLSQGILGALGAGLTPTGPTGEPCPAALAVWVPAQEPPVAPEKCRCPVAQRHRPGNLHLPSNGTENRVNSEVRNPRGKAAEDPQGATSPLSSGPSLSGREGVYALPSEGDGHVLLKVWQDCGGHGMADFYGTNNYLIAL